IIAVLWPLLAGVATPRSFEHTHVAEAARVFGFSASARWSVSVFFGCCCCDLNQSVIQPTMLASELCEPPGPGDGLGYRSPWGCCCCCSCHSTLPIAYSRFGGSGRAFCRISSTRCHVTS